MKKNLINSFNPLLAAGILLLLVSIIPPFLYTFDLISTALFNLSAIITGFLLYGLLGILFCKAIKKRQLLFGLAAVIMILIYSILIQAFELSKLFWFAGKLFFFLIIIFLHKKNSD